MLDPIPTDGKWLHRTAGIAAIAFGLAYLAIIALYVPMGPPPGGAEARLVYVAGNTPSWRAILSLSVLTDFLLVPVALSLYFVLQRFNRIAMLLASAFVTLFIVLDLSITWTNYAALITFGGKYAVAADDAHKAAIVTAAQYPSAILESGLLFVYNTLVLAIGILITGLVMLKGVFGRSTAYLAVATGALGVVSVVGPWLVPALSATIILTSILTTVWMLLVGYKLCGLGSQ